jgi:hypothetical protein
MRCSFASLACLLIAGALAVDAAPPAAQPTKGMVKKATRSSDTTTLFETTDGAKACIKALDAEFEYSREEAAWDASLQAAKTDVEKLDLHTKKLQLVGKKPPASGPTCSAGTLATLPAHTSVQVLKTEEALTNVKVLAGKNKGKRGWIRSDNLGE